MRSHVRCLTCLHLPLDGHSPTFSTGAAWRAPRGRLATSMAPSCLVYLCHVAATTGGWRSSLRLYTAACLHARLHAHATLPYLPHRTAHHPAAPLAPLATGLCLNSLSPSTRNSAALRLPGGRGILTAARTRRVHTCLQCGGGGHSYTFTQRGWGAHMGPHLHMLLCNLENLQRLHTSPPPCCTSFQTSTDTHLCLHLPLLPFSPCLCHSACHLPP